MTLRNVLYVSYAVPAGELLSLVPSPLSLATVGDNTAFLSVVVLRSTAVRLAAMPVFRFNYYQLNIRTYVIDPDSGNHAVYFLKSGVTSGFISVVTRVAGIPWQHISLDIETSPRNKTKSQHYRADGDWQGRFLIEARHTPDIPDLEYFNNPKDAVDFLVRPLIGFIGDSHRLGRFTIEHPHVVPASWQLDNLNLPLFSSLGIIKETDLPQSVFFLPEADFDIYMPPSIVRTKGG